MCRRLCNVGERAVLAGVVFLLVGASEVSPQVHRQGVRIPMRDEIELVADMRLPSAPGRHPVVLVRTPYMERANEGWMKTAREYAVAGYVFVLQDVRGRGDSEGNFNFFFTDAEDGFDTVQWITQQPWSNGRIGILGESYGATVQWLAAREGAPLTCMFPQAAAGRYFDELPYVAGAFMLQWALSWIDGVTGRTRQTADLTTADWDEVYRHRPLLTMDEAMGRPMPLYRAFLEHSTRDAYWNRILFEDKDFRNITVPAFTVTGWFDADQPGAIRYWEGMRRRSPARDRQHILIGPWAHADTRTGGDGLVGEMQFSRESVINIDALHKAYFDHCLKQDTGAFSFPPARVYVTGSNEWRDYDGYPPRTMKQRRLYVHSSGGANTRHGDGRLSWIAPGPEPVDRYTYDSKNPVRAGVGLDGSAGGDQHAVEERADVLAYSTDVLQEPIAVIGRVCVVLHAASDARDTVFTAKLADVYPDGRALRLGPKEVGIIRARYRQGYEREVLLTPNRPEEYHIELFDIGHTFLPGHRMRVEISSSASPFINPNQNTGNPVALDTDWKIARQTVFRDEDRPSYLLLPIVPRK